jgi:hypothetical protein
VAGFPEVVSLFVRHGTVDLAGWNLTVFKEIRAGHWSVPRNAWRSFKAAHVSVMGTVS